MAATSFGQGDWGIDADETGLLVSSIGYSYSSDSQEVRDRIGDVIGTTKYNEKTEISVEATVPDSGAFSQTISTSLSLTNTIPNHLIEGVSGGTIVIDSIDVNHEQEGYKSISISATHWPSVS